MAELYTLPDGWEWKKLGDLTTTTSGGTPKRNEKSYWGGNIGWLKSGELNDGYITSVEEYITNEGLIKSSAKLFPKGTLLIAMYGATVGKLGILEIETTTNQAICGILNDKNKFETFFMFYYFRKIREKMIEDSFGGAQPNLSQTYIKDLDIPLPPLAEQKKIVAKLDNLFAKIDKAIALHQKNIDEANVFMASVLNDVFVELEEKYEKSNINKIATIKGGKRVPKGYKLLEEATPYPYLRVTDFKDYGTICKEKMLYLSKEVYEQIKKYTITDEDLYITNVGNTIGKSGIIPTELNGANLTENAVKLVYKDKKHTSNKFMYYFTKSSIFLIQLESATMQMAVPKLAIMRLGEIELPFPPFKVQQKVVSYLDDISQKMEKVRQIQKEKMESLKALKASILDQAFRGEL